MVSFRRSLLCGAVTIAAVLGFSASAIAQTNVALNKPATASTSQAGNLAPQGCDASTTTRWAANGSIFPSWWRVDLGVVTAITGTMVNFYAARNYRYKIEVSNNDATYTVAVDNSATTLATQVRNDNFSASARYVRITYTAGSGNPSHWDFAVYSGTPPTTYTLTTAASNGTITRSPNATSYAAGTVVTLTANPNSGYQFSSWSGNLAGSTSPATITMNGNYSVTANFTATTTFVNGDMNYYNGTAWVRIPKGTTGQVLTENATTVPTWTNPDVVTDIDGNIYSTIKIGTQTWTKQNFKATRLNDGTAIPNVTGDAEWAALITPGMCYPENNISYCLEYGAYYNWFAINTGKLAPTGWHIPTDAEWGVLLNYVGGNGSENGGRLKEAGTMHWFAPNAGSNIVGFSAIGNGYRVNVGGFYEKNRYGSWWASTGGCPELQYDWNGYAIVYYSKQDGLGVRLVKD